MAQRLLKARTHTPSKPKGTVQEGSRFPGRVSFSGPQLHEAWMLPEGGFRVLGKRQVLAVAIGEGRGAHACMCTEFKEQKALLSSNKRSVADENTNTF